MSQYLPEITMRNATDLKLSLRARRCYDLAKEAGLRGNLRRAAMLSAMSQAYSAAGLGWMHARYGSAVAADLFTDSQDRISFARFLTEALDAPTVRVPQGAQA
jgi:hypothetical protein